MKNTFQSEKSTQSVLSDASKNLLMNHLNSFQDNNLETLMSDYTNESVLITEEATYTGLEEIELFFVELISHFPKQKSSFHLDKIIVNGGLAFITWHANTPTVDVPLGSDTFIFKNGKIYQQTFVGKLNYIN
jgi:hypothetical protein